MWLSRGSCYFPLSVSDCFWLPVVTRIEWLKQIRVLYTLLKDTQMWAVQGCWDSWYDRISGALAISDSTSLACDCTPQGSSWSQGGGWNSSLHVYVPGRKRGRKKVEGENFCCISPIKRSHGYATQWILLISRWIVQASKGAWRYNLSFMCFLAWKQ